MMIKRTAKLLLPLLAVAAVAVSASVAATTPPKTLAKYQACLKTHGVTFGGATRPSAAKTTAAFKACAALAPKGAAGAPAGGARFNSAAFKKYAACMTKHGVTFKRGSRPNRTTATYKAAQKACASLQPKRPANG
jgi:hypothetical protein